MRQTEDQRRLDRLVDDLRLAKVVLTVFHKDYFKPLGTRNSRRIGTRAAPSRAAVIEGDE